MPTVRAQGKKFTFPEGTTFDEIEAALSSHFNPEPSFTEKVISTGKEVLGTAEAGLSLLTGATTGLAAGILGVGEGITQELTANVMGTEGRGFSLDPDEQRETAKRIQQQSEERAAQYTYQPFTEGGKEKLESAAELLSPLQALPPTVQPTLQGVNASTLGGPIVREARRKVATTTGQLGRQTAQTGQQVATKIGQQARTIAESPQVQKAVSTSIEAGQKIGQKLAERGTKMTQGLIDRMTNAADKKTMDVFRSQADDTRLKTNIIRGIDIADKSRRTSKLIKNANKNGIGESTAWAIVGANKLDKAKFTSMATKARVRMSKGDAAGSLVDHTTPLGETVYRRWQKIVDVNEDAGKQLESIAKRTLQNVQFKPDQLRDRFNQVVESLGVAIKQVDELQFGDDIVRERGAVKSLLERVGKIVDLDTKERGARSLSPEAYKNWFSDKLDSQKAFVTKKGDLRFKTENIKDPSGGRTAIQQAWKQMREDIAKTEVKPSIETLKDWFNHTVDASGATIQNVNQLQKTGVSIDSIASARGMIEKAWKIIEDSDGNAYELHKAKQIIDELVNYDKPSTGVTGKSEKALLNLRSDINNALRSVSKKYADVNDRYSDTITAMNRFRDSAGQYFNPKKGDAKSIKQARNILGHIVRGSTRQDPVSLALKNSIDELEAVGAKYGINFSDDLQTQLFFNDEIERAMGIKYTPLSEELAGILPLEGARFARGDIPSSVADTGLRTIRGLLRGGAPEEKVMKSLERLTKESE